MEFQRNVGDGGLEWVLASLVRQWQQAFKPIIGGLLPGKDVWLICQRSGLPAVLGAMDKQGNGVSTLLKLDSELAAMLRKALPIDHPAPLANHLVQHPMWPKRADLQGCGRWILIEDKDIFLGLGVHRRSGGWQQTESYLRLIRAGFQLGRRWETQPNQVSLPPALAPNPSHQRAAEWLEAFESQPMRDVCLLAKKVAKTQTAVLITGETGTGKEVLSQALHFWSPRAGEVLTSVNCAGLKAELVESDLFGHVRGAFTGAETARRGKFQMSHQGTLFLDEIGELPLSIQPKFLRVLQEGQVEPLGATRPEIVDVRVVAATHRNLEADVQEGIFREDLFYRLAVFPLRMPSLAERKQDIPILVEQLFRQWRDDKLFPWIPHLTSGDMARLQQASWPGNIRQLSNYLKRLLVMAEGSKRLNLSSLKHWSHDKPHLPAPKDNRKWVDMERDHISAALEECGGRLYGKGGAAARLGIHPETLRARMRKLGLGSVKTFRREHGFTPTKKA